jgi:hypothetical protein
MQGSAHDKRASTPLLEAFCSVRSGARARLGDGFGYKTEWESEVVGELS